MLTKNNTVVVNKKEYDSTHLGPFDCGSADSYYQRLAKPHYYKENRGGRVDKADMTQEEIEAYLAGYEYNEKRGFKKDYD